MFRALPALLLLAAAPVTMARLLGGAAHSPLPQLASFAPLVLPLALAAAVLAVLGRRWVLTAVGLSLLVLHLIWAAPTLVVEPDAAGDAAPKGRPQVRVLSINAEIGQADPAVIVRIVRGRGIDVLVVPELTPELVTGLSEAGLGELLQPVSLMPARFSANGTGIWSRLPAQALPALPGTVHAMPRIRLRLPGGTAGTATGTGSSSSSGEVTVTLTAVHTQSPIPGRVRAWRDDLAAVRSALQGGSGPQVAVGDFNATRDHAPFRVLVDGSTRGADGAIADAAEARGFAAWPGFTWPANAGLPALVRIDHLLFSRSSVRVTGLDVVDVPRTDHRGLVVTMVFS